MADIHVRNDNDMIRFSRKDHFAWEIKDRFKLINHSVLGYIEYSIKNSDTEIMKADKYLLAVLYSAPLTMDAFYQSRIPKGKA